jgi:hypothetical protein
MIGLYSLPASLERTAHPTFICLSFVHVIFGIGYTSRRRSGISGQYALREDGFRSLRGEEKKSKPHVFVFCFDSDSEVSERRRRQPCPVN